MKATELGDFEELVLMTICVIGSDAYAVNVKSELEERLKKKINISAIHTALYRLEDKGFLKSEIGGATKERGGRRKRLFTPTSAGKSALNRLKIVRERMYKLIPGLTNG
ncbi:MAG: helix-turn-helix transcriptional regulator [Bacteroidota bacterium]